MRDLLELRRSFAREVLSRPREGVVQTLRELRTRGLRTGLITVCSEDAVDVWPETPFAGLFNAEVFSCSCGYRKPDPRIFELACAALVITPEEAVLLDDIGANLKSARALGMTTIKVVDPDMALAELEVVLGFPVR